MTLRTICSVLHSMIDAQSVAELRAVAEEAKSLDLGTREKELLNEFWNARKVEIEEA